MAAYHSGKNIWSTTLFGSVPGSQQIICGAADSKITAHALPTCQAENGGSGLASNEYTVEDILAMSGSDPSLNIPPRTAPAPKSAKQGHSFRGYAFVDDESFLLITNAGKVLLETLKSEVEADGAPTISQSKLIDQLDELSNYSVCAADSTLGLGFIAGSRGGIYMYQKGSTELLKLHAVQGKVGGLFIGQQLDSTDTGQITLLVTLMGQKMAKLLYLDVCKESKPSVLKNIDIMISESSTGTTITSVVYIPAGADEDHLILGFRGGSVAAYSLANDSATDANKQVTASFVEKAHGKEAVTSLLWHPSSSPSRGHLISAGRDGCCAVHSIDFPTSTISLSHNLPLAVGPNLEGLYFHHNHLIMYGFSGTKFIVYDITVEEEIMSVETGGSHRSWSFRPSTPPGGGGTLVWTRAATMHIYTQTGSNHTVIRSGGHGREIKDVAVTHTDADDNDFRTLIATGAEDTDIRIFEYVGNDYVCRRTLRKHNTGIQHLQWSSDNHYLFSSGGCEEFFVWRIRSLPQFMGIGIVCEAICPPQSELPDVRITSFDVGRPSNRGSGFVIAMVFSDSMIRVYHYDPGAMGERWNMLAKGAYFTSCLTQCVFLSPSSIFTAGTDGHAVLWPLQEAIQDEAFSTQSLTWHSPARIHQNTSKAISTHSLDNGSTLLVSGGDDGSLAFLLASQMEESYTHSPIVVVRAHASAITACTILWQQQDHICVLTSGNDQWVRLWDVKLTSSAVPTTKKPDGSLDPLTIKRATRIKTNVADVSSMAIIETDPTRTRAKVMICGVGMDVLRLEWQAVD
jgi:WD40 repeat protein